MSYQPNNIIAAADFNVITSGNESGTSISMTSPNLNYVLGTGYGDVGYGQLVVKPVISENQVSAIDWTQLTTTVVSLGAHQQSTLGGMSIPVTGNIVQQIYALQSNVDLLYTNRKNAKKQGTSALTAVTNTSPWATKLTFTFQISFESGDAARYFFNSGGQISLKGSHASTTTSSNLDKLFTNLMKDIGTLYLSSPSTGPAVINNTAFSGITQLDATNALVDNPNLRPIFNTNCGYYALNTTPQLVFKQQVNPDPSALDYNSTYAALSVYSNGTQGLNGDAGSQITVVLQLVEVPSEKNVLGATTASLSILSPDTTNIVNSWGPISVRGFATPEGVVVVPPPPPVPNIICISVIDEDSAYSASNSTSDWSRFRATYPNRNFYLLQPLASKSNSIPGQNLKIPATFKTDTKAFGPLRVNRDNGVSSQRSDWFAICNLAAVPPNTKVALSIDNSGSMTTGTVQASYNYFLQRCAAANIPVTFNIMKPAENWISIFIQTF